MSEAARPNKWLIALTVMTPAFMAVMDISVVNVALPHMMGTFGLNDLSAITWVATSYSIAEVIMLSMAGWWSTLIGRRRLLIASLLLFTGGSILAGTARTFEAMLLWRTLQGIGGGSLIPLSQAILRESFPPEEQGMAMAVYGMGVVLAPAAGPVLGGWLTDHYGWPWIFYINVPASAVSLLLVATFIHDPPYLRRGVQKIDWAGIGLLAIGMTTLQVFLERGQEENWFESNLIVVTGLATLVSLVALLIWELKTDDPIINLRLMRNRALTLGSLMGFVFGISLFGTTFILPQFTQKLLGYTAYDSGLVLLPRAIALFFAMPVAGWLYRHLDPKLLVLAGVGLIVLSYWQLAHLTLQTDFWNLIPALIVMGLGMPFMFVTTSTISLSTVDPSDMTEASSLYTLARRIGGNVGYALVATLVARREQFHYSRLIEHVSALEPAYRAFHARAAAALVHGGVSPEAAGHTANALLGAMVNRQASMLAYDDVAYATGILFLVMIPLTFLLPSIPHTGGKTKGGGH